jgi:pyruvate dehydrogenase E2 component (dihydrolipoamide acetyltransferase)
MPPIDVTLEQDSANDEDAVVIAIHRPSGVAITQGTPIVDIETSKAVQELEAPADGVLFHSLAVGVTVEFGSILFSVLPPGTTPDIVVAPLPAPAALAPIPAAKVAPVSATAVASAASLAAPVAVEGPSESGEVLEAAPRKITDRARAFAAEAGVDVGQIGGSFITIDHVRRHLGQTKSAGALKAALAPVKPSPVPADATPLAPRKRREIRTLSRGAGGGMLSVIGAAVGGVRRAGAENNFFADRIVDIVAFEASRLMPSYPLLNAAYVDGDNVRLHDQINAGVAFDDGENGLVVFSIEGSDKLSIPEIQDRFVAGLENYVLGSLSSREMNAATFTITDLSYVDVDYVLPLLPAGQSAIIGITRESAGGGFRLFIGFDHRVTEGRVASLFLQELARRVRSFDSGPSATAEDLSCNFCGKDNAAETGSFQSKGLLRIVDRRGRDVLCCSACYGGW